MEHHPPAREELSRRQAEDVGLHGSSVAERRRAFVEDGKRAARLLAAAEALLASIGAFWFPAEQVEQEAMVATIREELGETTFAAAWAEGSAMTGEEAAEYALLERMDS